MGSVVGTVRIVPRADRFGAVIEILRAVQGPVRALPGCLACEIYEEQGSRSAVVFVERWESAEALEEHLRSETYRRILGAIELSESTPEIRFEHVSSSEGLELIARARRPE